MIIPVDLFDIVPVNMSVNLGVVSYCELTTPPATGARIINQKTTSFEESIRIYPNPVSSELIIERTSANAKAVISMFNIVGQLVKQVDMQSKKQMINVAKLSKGLYLLRMTDESGTVLKTDRIVIK